MNAETEAAVANYYRTRLFNLCQRIEQEIESCPDPVMEMRLRGIIATEKLHPPEEAVRWLSEQPSGEEEVK